MQDNMCVFHTLFGRQVHGNLHTSQHDVLRPNLNYKHTCTYVYICVHMCTYITDVGRPFLPIHHLSNDIAVHSKFYPSKGQKNAV